jgi:hypothetical protein
MPVGRVLLSGGAVLSQRPRCFFKFTRAREYQIVLASVIDG